MEMPPISQLRATKLIILLLPMFIFRGLGCTESCKGCNLTSLQREWLSSLPSALTKYDQFHYPAHVKTRTQTFVILTGSQHKSMTMQNCGTAWLANSDARGPKRHTIFKLSTTSQAHQTIQLPIKYFRNDLKNANLKHH